MELKTTNDMLEAVAQRWKRQYQNQDGTWRNTSDKNSDDVYKKLLSIKSTSKELVKSIIGNDSWVWQYCDVCGDHSYMDHIVDDDDCDEGISICSECITKAYKLL